MPITTALISSVTLWAGLRLHLQEHDREGAKGANIRVQDIFARCIRVGKWSDRPANLTVCLAFVTLMKNVNLATKQMDNVPRKHIGIYNFGSIWHYSNTGDKVVKQLPEQFGRHYAGSDIGVFYGELPV